MEYRRRAWYVANIMQTGSLDKCLFLLDLSLGERFHLFLFKEKLKYLSSEEH